MVRLGYGLCRWIDHVWDGGVSVLGAVLVLLVNQLYNHYWHWRSFGENDIRRRTARPRLPNEVIL